MNTVTVSNKTKEYIDYLITNICAVDLRICDEYTYKYCKNVISTRKLPYPVILYESKLKSHVVINNTKLPINLYYYNSIYFLKDYADRNSQHYSYHYRLNKNDREYESIICKNISIYKEENLYKEYFKDLEEYLTDNLNNIYNTYFKCLYE